MAMPTSYREFVDDLEALTITGVNRQYTQGPPTGASGVADCPCQFVVFPGGSERALVFGMQGGWPSLRAELWVGVGPVGQDVGPENFDNGVDMMDNVSDALRSAECITRAHFTWDIDLVERPIAGMMYWVVLTRIEGSG